MNTWTKTYDSADAATAAARKHAWIRGLGALEVPALISQDGNTLTFSHVDGRYAGPHSLKRVAQALARFHVAAHQCIRTTPASHDLNLHPFSELRQQRAIALLAGPDAPITWLNEDSLRYWLRYGERLPPAVYKDANVRNFLTTTSSVVAVDFDALTLAPFGYDLAKLVVSAAMTYGPLPIMEIEAVLAEYNQVVRGVGLPACTPSEFDAWSEINHVLTSPYLGKHGYNYAWRTTAQT